jgi:hypothetical protein
LLQEMPVSSGPLAFDSLRDAAGMHSSINEPHPQLQRSKHQIATHQPPPTSTKKSWCLEHSSALKAF